MVDLTGPGTAAPQRVPQSGLHHGQVPLRRTRELRRRPWEDVDWAPFDLIGVDAYRAAHNADGFREHVRELVTRGKPVAVTEYGTCAYRGAGDLGGMAWQPPADAVPDEYEQLRYLEELLDIFETEGVDTAFWFSFANCDKPGARDIASYGVVRMLDETRWEPKQVFRAMASRYQR